LSGMGLPFALTLIKPSLDVWSPGEHNGTFRGNNHAFVTASATLKHFWKDTSFIEAVRARGDFLKMRLENMAKKYNFTAKGKGMMRGLDVGSGEVAAAITSEAFNRGLIIETSGAFDEVVKVLAPLTITESELTKGLDILDAVIQDFLSDNDSKVA
jgi:diaminobutyrate-2-oxoglutarate transaminase